MKARYEVKSKTARYSHPGGGFFLAIMTFQLCNLLQHSLKQLDMMLFIKDNPV